MKALRRQIQNIAWICRPLWTYGKLYMILSICVLGLYSSLDDIIYVRFPEIMIDLLSAGRPFPHIAGVAILICGLDLSINVARKLSRGYFTKKQTAIDLRLKLDIYKKAMALDYRYIDDPQYYDSYTWTVSEYAEQVKAGRELLVDLFQCAMSIAVLVTIISSMGPWVLLVEVVQMALHILVNTQVDRSTIKRKEALVPLDRRLDYFHRLFYMKEYAADMKATPLCDTVFAEYAKAGRRKLSLVSTYAWKEEFWNCVHELIFFGTQITIVLYLISGIISGQIPEVGMYMTLLLSFYRLDSKIDALTYVLKDANVLSMNGEKIRKFFDLPSEIETNEAYTAAVPEGDAFSVEFSHVSFSYEDPAFALSDLSLSIKPREKLAIVGENGAGKSTLMKLLLRLYDIQSGEIRIHGRPIQAYDIHSLRRRIGVAFQNTNIYAMTLAENISLYGKASGASLHDISEKLSLDTILQKNDADFDAELTREFYDDGLILSGGEMQKVALARAMSGDFGLLLLDEPSSALDPLAEHKMQQAILSTANRATTIIVAHRLSTIRDADRIAVLERGRIRECGSHDELMALRGAYYEMFTKQAEKYVDP